VAWLLIALSLVVIIQLSVAVLIRRLRTCHPETYVALGAPSLNPTKATGLGNWGLTRFIWVQNPLRVGDPQVVVLVWGVRLWFVAFVLWCFWPLLFARSAV